MGAYAVWQSGAISSGGARPPPLFSYVSGFAKEAAAFKGMMPIRYWDSIAKIMCGIFAIKLGIQNLSNSGDGGAKLIAQNKRASLGRGVVV